jgi:hypothetical protein
MNGVPESFSALCKRLLPMVIELHNFTREALRLSGLFFLAILTAPQLPETTIAWWLAGTSGTRMSQLAAQVTDRPAGVIHYISINSPPLQTLWKSSLSRPRRGMHAQRLDLHAATAIYHRIC